MPKSSRRLQWFMVSFVGAALVGAAHIIMTWVQAQGHPNDGAYGEPLSAILLDPFVISIAVPFVLLGGLIAFVLALLWLDATVLWKTTAFIYAIILLEIIVVGSWNTFYAVVFSLPALIAAGILSKWLFTRMENPSNTRLHPTAAVRDLSSSKR
jgi:hypothetical protein